MRWNRVSVAGLMVVVLYSAAPRGAGSEINRSKRTPGSVRGSLGAGEAAWVDAG